MKFIDLFAGIGGFRYGLEGGGIKNKGQSERIPLGNQKGQNKQRPNRGAKRQFSCVWSNEWDEYANQVYRKHYGECDDRDIRAVEASEIPKHDLICAGFPCQSFSIAGKRKGFDDTRGTLFYEICRIAGFHRTPYLLLENVKGLLNHDQGQTFSIILESLDELGYDLQWQVLNSKNFGVPQNRERVFIIGHLRGECRPKVFPIEKAGGFANVGNAKVANTLQHPGHSGGNYKGMTMVRSVLTPDRTTKRQRGRRIKEEGEPSFTLTGQDKHGVAIGTGIRRLTPTECERLQGFPDGWTEGISDTQRYKCLGNAVTTNVVTEIGKLLKKGGDNYENHKSYNSQPS